MTHEEFQDWLIDEVVHQRMTTGQMNDLLEQKALFDSNRTMIELEFRWRVVGYVDNQRRVEDDVHKLLETSDYHNRGKMVYFEPVGFDLL
jgi:hypothetical protein